MKINFCSLIDHTTTDKWDTRQHRIKIFLFPRYETARSIIDSLFGTRTHPDFPIVRREKDNSCSGSGEYPSSLGSGHTEYKHTGVDIVIENRKTVLEKKERASEEYLLIKINQGRETLSFNKKDAF